MTEFEPRNRRVVEARQYDGTNYDVLALWCHGTIVGDGDGTGQRYRIEFRSPGSGWPWVARAGDWIIHEPHADPEWSVMPEAMFAMSWQPLPECVCGTPGGDYDGPLAVCDRHGQPSVAYEQGQQDAALIAALRDANPDRVPPPPPWETMLTSIAVPLMYGSPVNAVVYQAVCYALRDDVV